MLGLRGFLAKILFSGGLGVRRAWTQTQTLPTYSPLHQVNFETYILGTAFLVHISFSLYVL